MTTGEKIQALRHSKGWTQKELAERLTKATGNYPVSRDMLANWENDRHPFPWNVGIALTKIFKVTLDQLIMENLPIKAGRAKRA